MSPLKSIAEAAATEPDPNTEPSPCDVAILLKANEQGVHLDVQLQDGVDEQNHAVRFAHFIGENAQALMLLFNQQNAACAKAFEEGKADRPINLVTPQGERMQ
jgi:hypothetical protein